MNFTEWISSTAGTTMLLGIVGFLSRHWILDRLANSIKYKYDKDLKTHEANLKRDYDVQIEKLKAQLQLANVRFSHVFAKQADTVIECYQKLIPIIVATVDYKDALSLRDKPTQSEKVNVLNGLRNEFHTFFFNNRIFLPTVTGHMVQQCVNMLGLFASKTSIANNMRQWPERTEDVNAGIDRLNKEAEELETEFNKLMEMLVLNLQTILGFETEDKKTEGNKA